MAVRCVSRRSSPFGSCQDFGERTPSLTRSQLFTALLGRCLGVRLHLPCAASRAGKIASWDPFGCKHQRRKQHSAAGRRSGHRTCAIAQNQKPRGNARPRPRLSQRKASRRCAAAGRTPNRVAFSFRSRSLRGRKSTPQFSCFPRDAGPSAPLPRDAQCRRSRADARDLPCDGCGADRRRRSSTRSWRGAGSWRRAGRDPHSCSRRHVIRAAVVRSVSESGGDRRRDRTPRAA